MKKANHQANIVRIAEIRPHTNADTLELITIGGYQVVSKKGQFKVGDLAVYIQPDSVVPQTGVFEFVWGGKTEELETVPERRRRITVRKFRGEWSEGLLMPVTDFSSLVHQGYGSLSAYESYVDEYTPSGTLKVEEGDDVSDRLGITHYDPDAGRERTTAGEVTAPPSRRYPKTAKGWFYFLVHKFGFKKAGQQATEEMAIHVPEYDVDALKNFANVIQEGEDVIIAEKIHGSNARYIYLNGHMYAGSRKLWKAANSNCVWRKALKQHPWIEKWCRANEGHTLYGEVVPTQDKFNYGCKAGEVKFFAFDIFTPEGEWKKPYVTLGVEAVAPVYWSGPYSDLVVKAAVDGPSKVEGANHIREGIVITPIKERRIPGLGRVQLKLVSNEFLKKDSQ